MIKSTLQQQLETLSAARYPLHMPGHKRRVPPAPGLGCYAWDLTEIDGADDLHDADGILADAMARTAVLVPRRRVHRRPAGGHPRTGTVRQHGHCGAQLPQGRLPRD